MPTIQIDLLKRSCNVFGIQHMRDKEIKRKTSDIVEIR